MKKSKFSDTQIVSILKQAEAGMPVKEVCQHNVNRESIMRRLVRSKSPALLILACLFASAQSATAPPTNLEVGRHYLDSLYTFDYSELEKTLDANAIFEDPTAVAFAGEAWRITGRKAILEFFREASEHIVEGGFEVQSEFSTGEYVVFDVEYRSKFNGEALGVPGKIVSVKIPGVTILQIRNGLVTRHIDHADYDELHKQVATQSE